MKLETFFKKLGYDIEPRSRMLPYIEKWRSWYKGDVTSFHYYDVYNGTKTIRMHRKSLKLAKKSSQDFAGYLMNEKVKFNFDDEKTSEYMNSVLDNNCFFVMANEAIEKMCALGTGAFVLSVTDLIYDENTGYIDSKESNLKIQFVTADKIIPLSYSGNKITECAFAVNQKIGNKEVLAVSIHLFENKRYIIYNYLFKVGRGGNLTDVTEEMDDTLRVFDTQSELPWYTIIRPNIVNNIYNNSPYGISIFANAVDEMEGIDIAYDSLINEFSLGRKRIFVTDDLLKLDPITHEPKMSFDSNDIVFHQLPGAEIGENKGEQIKESNMTLRVSEHKEGIQLNLNLFTSKIGMGDNVYTFDGKGIKTATEVISENSDLYRTIKKYEIILEDSFTDLFKSMLFICNKFLNAGIKEDSAITIEFDDSIIEDKAEIKRQALLELNAGLIDKVEYFILTRNLTEEQAKELVDKMEKRSPAEEEPPIEEE